MLKISPKITKPVQRYFTRNTVRAKYDRNMDTAMLSGIAGLAEVASIPTFGIGDVGILAFLGTVCSKSIAQSFKYLKELQPIKKRAIRIKKFVKLQRKLQKKMEKEAAKKL